MSRGWWSLLSLVLVACNQSDFDADPNGPNPDGPGTPQWGDDNVTCSADKDCHYGEACVNSVCQMKRCGKQYTSNAPLGARRAFLHDREIVASDATSSGGAYYVRGYSPNGYSMSSAGGWDAGGTHIKDVAGGALLADGPELVAVIRDNDSYVQVPAINKWIDTGFVPVAIAAGDVDHDGLDEIIALGGGGQFAVCNIDAGKCDRYDWNAGTVGYDVAAGDIDGDGIDEAVFHLDLGGQKMLVVWNADAKTTGQPDVYQINTDPFMAITVADIDGDGRAEIFALEDGGWLGLASDKIFTFTSNGSALGAGASVSVSRSSVDIAGGDLDHDKTDELVLLTSDRVAHVLRGGSLSEAYTSTLDAGSPERIAAVDFDGDSTVGKLMAGPDLVAGQVVPTTVMYMPPYYETLVDPDQKPTVTMGNSTSNEQSRTDSVGLTVGLTVGVEGEIPDVVSGEISVNLESETTFSKTIAASVTVSASYTVQANPSAYGVDEAAIALSCGCFHQYTYELQSPAVGGDGHKLVVLVPVGGESLLWSTKRYNAMAKAVGNLPIIDVPSKVGDPHSYPKAPQRSDGSAIPAADMVFTSVPATRLSDVAAVEWSLSTEHNQTTSTATNTSLGVDASVTVVGVKLGGSVSTSWGQGYDVSVGSTFDVGGSIPPLKDDPKTPEDEYTVYSYGFQPVVYRQYYTAADGSQAAYYVVNYAVAF